MFPSPSGDTLFKFRDSALLEGVEFVSVPFRGSFIQMVDVMNYDKETGISVPFRGSFIQIRIERLVQENQAVFPSPSGDPLFK